MTRLLLLLALGLFCITGCSNKLSEEETPIDPAGEVDPGPEAQSADDV